MTKPPSQITRAGRSVCFDPQIFSFFTRSGAAKYFAQLSVLIQRYGWTPYFPFHFSINQHYFELGGRQLWRIPEMRGDRRLCNFLNSRSKVDRSKYSVWHSTLYDRDLIEIYGAEGMVATVHDMIPELMPSHFTTNPHGDKEEYVARAQRVIAISENTKSDICKLYGTSPSKIDVVYHGIDPDDCDVTEMNLPEDYVLFIGARSGYKNFDILVRAFAALSKAHPSLWLVCIGVQPFSRAELDTIEGLRIRNVVRTTATDSQMRHALKKARAFVYPSLYEGFGIPIIEAMVQRCPLVVADASCFPEIARDSALYFDPHEVGSLVSSLERVLVDAALRDRLTALGSLVVKDFSLDAMLKRTAEVYEKAAP